MQAYGAELERAATGGSGTFEDILRRAAASKILQGQQGLRDFPASKNPVLEKRNFHISEPVVDLACKLVAKGEPIDPHRYAAAMLNAEIYERADGVEITFPSGFRRDYANEHFGLFIRRHYGKPVRFVYSPSAHQMMMGADQPAIYSAA